MAAVCVTVPDPSAFVPVKVIVPLVGVKVQLGAEPETAADHKSTLMTLKDFPGEVICNEP